MEIATKCPSQSCRTPTELPRIVPIYAEKKFYAVLHAELGPSCILHMIMSHTSYASGINCHILSYPIFDEYLDNLVMSQVV